MSLRKVLFNSIPDELLDACAGCAATAAGATACDCNDDAPDELLDDAAPATSKID